MTSDVPTTVIAPGAIPASYALTARFGFMRSLGDFAAEDAGLRRGDWVVLATERGTEIGDVLVGPRALEDGRDPAALGLGRVLRRATAEDLARRRTIEGEEALREFQTCRRLAAAEGLGLKVVAVEHLFGGERLIFYFTAEVRVDFRGLVRELARAFHTRIEMRQIGARDEARLLGDVGHCGQQLCCKTFLRELEPVSMRMARSQKATLDPSKISGACGRLMCCLRYEDETYRELKRDLPPLGAVYRWKLGPAEVIGHEILARRVVLLTEGGRRVDCRAEELTPELFLEQREPRLQPFEGERDGAGRRDGRERARSARLAGAPAADADADADGDGDGAGPDGVAAVTGVGEDGEAPPGDVEGPAAPGDPGRGERAASAEGEPNEGAGPPRGREGVEEP